ncbi:MAG TPA: LuxR C-terminal-related transcriptional regulator [Acidimicrobiales bacterium]|nr:LuxR C-terminal-related transcriptional regulator [Acidimicrobiales bacterium]
MSWRTPVFIYASDPMSAAGAKAQLVGQPTIELVGPADLDRARVALVVADAADEAATKVIRAIQRDGVPRVVLVAARFDEAGVVAAVAAGVTSFLRRSEATSSRLTEVIRQADESGCQLPEGLLKKAAAAFVDCGPAAVMPAPESDRHANGSTMTLRLSKREVEVLRLVADGLDTGDIAEQLSYSESTIKGVLAKIMTRLEARNRCHAVAIVVREGLI